MYMIKANYMMRTLQSHINKPQTTGKSSEGQSKMPLKPRSFEATFSFF